jgi:putative ABC transport system permease protein
LAICDLQFEFAMLNFLFETFRLGVKNLRLHKLRSLLTALGIIFGVFAVIVMVAIGQGGKEAALSQIRQLGATNILVRSIRPPESNQASNRQQRILDYGLKRSDLHRLQTLLTSDKFPDGLLKVVPLRDVEQDVVRADLKVNSKPVGTSPDIFELINLSPARGRVFTPAEYEQGAAVCVLGAVTARQLFPYQDPLGQTVRVGTTGMGMMILTVVGVLDPTGLRPGSEGADMMQLDLDQTVFFPLTLAQETFGDAIVRRQAGTQERKQIELTQVWLKARTVDHVESLASVASNLMAITHQNLNDVDVKAPIQILRTAEQTQRRFNLVMGMIAAISLVVGGIGIMNIMLASVTERTREIGIRRALGAKQWHITVQFLIETTVISLSGGLIGVGMGTGFAAVLPLLVDAYPTSITSWSVILSFAVSGFVGIAFGLYPAMTAARMNPIEALRHE